LAEEEAAGVEVDSGAAVGEAAGVVAAVLVDLEAAARGAVARAAAGSSFKVRIQWFP